MKSEEREELQQNDLAAWMYHVPFFLKNYGSYLLLGVALLVLAWRVWDWHETNVARELQQAWTSLNETSRPTYNNPPSKLRDIISQTDNRPLAAFAYTKLGKFYLEYLNLGTPAEGLQGVKVPADQAAKEAREAFSKVIADYPDQVLALADARLGLGALYEDLHQWDDARKQYDAIADKQGPLGESAFADVARRRLANLDLWSQPALLIRTSASTAASSEPATGPAATLPALLPATTVPAATAPAHAAGR